MQDKERQLRLSKMKEIFIRMRKPEYFVRKFHDNLSTDREAAKDILEKGLSTHPENLTLNYIKVTNFTKEECSEKLLINWRKIIQHAHEEYLDYEDYRSAYSFFQAHGTVEDCKVTLERQILEFPDDLEQLLTYVNKFILCYEMHYGLSDSINILKRIVPYSSDKNKLYIILAILLKLMNENEQSKVAVDNIPKIEKETMENVKVELYNNGDSKIEYYKKPTNTESLVVSFDHMYMNWKQQPFGFPFLEKQDVDVVAIRKRKKHTFQQDLTLEDFEKTVKPLLNHYKNIVFYGHSLGAYLALYYGALFNNINILATAPRLSIHPEYGSKKLADSGFKHNYEINYNRQVKPIIVYDPKNKRDSNYIENGINKSYPNAHLIQIPYGGHGMVKHLYRTGQLKKFVTMVLNNKTPFYEKEYRCLSSDYYRELANRCLKTGKMKWANLLGEKALELSPDDYKSIKLQTKIYLKCDERDKALKLLEMKKEKVKRKPVLMLELFDIYISKKRINSAQELLEHMRKKCKVKDVEIRERTVKELIP